MRSIVGLFALSLFAVGCGVSSASNVSALGEISGPLDSSEPEEEASCRRDPNLKFFDMGVYGIEDQSFVAEHGWVGFDPETEFYFLYTAGGSGDDSLSDEAEAIRLGLDYEDYIKRLNGDKLKASDRERVQKFIAAFESRWPVCSDVASGQRIRR